MRRLGRKMPVCWEHMPAAKLNHVYWSSLCGHLAVYLAEDKHQWHHGVWWVSVRHTRRKASRSRREATQTIRCLAQERGGLINYSQGISYVRILATEVSWLIGTEEEPDYDREVQMDPALCTLAEGIESLISEFGPLGRPLWPPVVSSLVATFESGEAKRNMEDLSTDSSPAGWAALLRWWGGG